MGLRLRKSKEIKCFFPVKSGVLHLLKSASLFILKMSQKISPEEHLLQGMRTSKYIKIFTQSV